MLGNFYSEERTSTSDFQIIDWKQCLFFILKPWQHVDEPDIENARRQEHYRDEVICCNSYYIKEKHCNYFSYFYWIIFKMKIDVKEKESNKTCGLLAHAAL